MWAECPVWAAYHGLGVHEYGAIDLSGKARSITSYLAPISEGRAMAEGLREDAATPRTVVYLWLPPPLISVSARAFRTG